METINRPPHTNPLLCEDFDRVIRMGETPVYIPYKKINPETPDPEYAKPGDSGFDLYAMETVIIQPGETKLIPVGLAFDLPPSVEIQVRPKSGLSYKTNFMPILGTVDSPFRGEVSVIAYNRCLPEYEIRNGQIVKIQSGMARELTGKLCNVGNNYDKNSIVVHYGQKIAQGVFCLVYKGLFEQTDLLSETERGSGGFGHTGI